MRILHKRREDRAPESNISFAPARIRRRRCARHDFGELEPHRADNVPGWTSRISGLMRFLGVVLVLVALSPSVQATQSVTLAWNRNADTNVVGYFRYYGATSHNYTNMVDAGNVTTATIPGLVEGTTYFFAVTDHTAAGLESAPSN